MTDGMTQAVEDSQNAEEEDIRVEEYSLFEHHKDFQNGRATREIRYTLSPNVQDLFIREIFDAMAEKIIGNRSGGDPVTLEIQVTIVQKPSTPGDQFKDGGMDGTS